MIAVGIFLVVLLCLTLYLVTIMQDIRDVVYILAFPFLYEKGSPEYELLEKTGRKNINRAFKKLQATKPKTKNWANPNKPKTKKRSK